MLKKEKLAQRMVVIAPSRPATNTWPVEKDEWLEFKDLKVICFSGKDRAQRDKLVMEDADIYVLNPELLDWFTTKMEGSRYSPLDYLEAEVLVVDESSKFKDTQSARFKLLKNHLKKFLRRITLTGSPAPNGYIDVFGQVYVTDMGMTLGKYVTHFRRKYFDSTGFGGYTYVLKEDGKKQIERAIKPVVYRVESEQYLELPEFILDPEWCTLPADARRIYDQLEKDFIAKIGSGDIVTAKNGAVASGKCSQVANGGLWLDPVPGEKRVAEECLHSAKTEALLDLVDSLGGKQMLVLYDYQHDFLRIQKALGGKVPYIGGGVSAKQALQIQNEWNAGDIQILLGHPASMGHGLNLQKSACEHVCWYSPTWNYDDWDQANKRVRRQGNSASRVFVHMLLAKDTVDMAKYAAMQNKAKTQKELMDAMRRYSATRKRVISL